MSYLTYTEYEVINPTTTLEDDEEFEFLADRASDILNDVTKNRINFFGFDNFSADTQTAIQKATAAQIDILDAEGGSDAVNGNTTSGLSSVSIGRYSEGRNSSTTSGASYELINGVPISPMVRMYLRPTNLMYKGVSCFTIDDFNI